MIVSISPLVPDPDPTKMTDLFVLHKIKIELIIVSKAYPQTILAIQAAARRGPEETWDLARTAWGNKQAQWLDEPSVKAAAAKVATDLLIGHGWSPSGSTNSDARAVYRTAERLSPKQDDKGVHEIPGTAATTKSGKKGQRRGEHGDD